MHHGNRELARVLRNIDLGSSVAELDNLLKTARVETSVFGDILSDRVDLIPGTKGSGKSALYRIFVDFLPEHLLKQRKVVVAHGVKVAGEQLFQVFNDRFSKLSEDDFVDFWCIYLVSLADEHFVRQGQYGEYLVECDNEVKAFENACTVAKIPRLGKRKPVREVLDWALNAVLSRVNPKMTVKPADGTIEFTLFDVPPPAASASADERNVLQLPRYIVGIKDHLEAVLEKADLHLWLMIDRLDEIFLRRSELETRALRGLLRTLQVFQSPRIRVKIFLRDDILEQVTLGTAGFTALTHITARRADSLQWSAEQILDLIVKRVFSSDVLCRLLQVDEEKLRASREYREEVFYQFFPPTVHRGARQSTTLRWIYNHTMDGRGVVTPRDVIDLLTRARQKQEDEFEADPGGSASYVIGSAAIRYGLAELSRWKRDSLLRAEYPHCWPHIEKFQRGKAEYTERAIKRVLGKDAMHIVQDLIGIGVIGETKTKGARTFKIPFLYREGLDVTQGLQE